MSTGRYVRISAAIRFPGSKIKQAGSIAKILAIHGNDVARYKVEFLDGSIATVPDYYIAWLSPLEELAAQAK